MECVTTYCLDTYFILVSEWDAEERRKSFRLQWKTCGPQTQISAFVNTAYPLLANKFLKPRATRQSRREFLIKGTYSHPQANNFTKNTEWERQKTNTHKRFQSFSDEREAWLRLFRNVEHI